MSNQDLPMCHHCGVRQCRSIYRTTLSFTPRMSNGYCKTCHDAFSEAGLVLISQEVSLDDDRRIRDEMMAWIEADMDEYEDEDEDEDDAFVDCFRCITEGWPVLRIYESSDDKAYEVTFPDGTTVLRCEDCAQVDKDIHGAAIRILDVNDWDALVI